jgi:hypothetical protein
MNGKAGAVVLSPANQLRRRPLTLADRMFFLTTRVAKQADHQQMRAREISTKNSIKSLAYDISRMTSTIRRIVLIQHITGFPRAHIDHGDEQALRIEADCSEDGEKLLNSMEKYRICRIAVAGSEFDEKSSPREIVVGRDAHGARDSDGLQQQIT